jgi:hypothetical protein
MTRGEFLRATGLRAALSISHGVGERRWAPRIPLE